MGINFGKDDVLLSIGVFCGSGDKFKQFDGPSMFSEINDLQIIQEHEKKFDILFRASTALEMTIEEFMSIYLDALEQIFNDIGKPKSSTVYTEVIISDMDNMFNRDFPDDIMDKAKQMERAIAEFHASRKNKGKSRRRGRRYNNP